MGEGKLLDILIFAMIAGVIFLRLRSVLGRRTGQEKRPRDLVSRRGAEAGEDKVVPLPDRAPRASADPAEIDAEAAAADEAEGALAPGFARIRAADRDFDPRSFVEGARVAYEMIVTAFAASDSLSNVRVDENRRSTTPAS